MRLSCRNHGPTAVGVLFKKVILLQSGVGKFEACLMLFNAREKIEMVLYRKLEHFGQRQPGDAG